MAKKRSSDHPVGEPRLLGLLIDRLGPLNNACRASEGIDKVELLWDMGEALLSFMPEASDDLLWTISERSYLTRDILPAQTCFCFCPNCAWQRQVTRNLRRCRRTPAHGLNPFPLWPAASFS